MGLFSSKSSSKSTTTNQTTNTYTDKSVTTSGTIGDLSEGNIIAGGNATITGYSAEETKDIIDGVLEATISAITDSVEGIKNVTGQAITQVQSAYSGANDAILESQNETKATLNSLKPYAFYAMLAVIAYFVWGKRK